MMWVCMCTRVEGNRKAQGGGSFWAFTKAIWKPISMAFLRVDSVLKSSSGKLNDVGVYVY